VRLNKELYNRILGLTIYGYPGNNVELKGGNIQVFIFSSMPYFEGQDTLPITSGNTARQWVNTKIE